MPCVVYEFIFRPEVLRNWTCAYLPEQNARHAYKNSLGASGKMPMLSKPSALYARGTESLLKRFSDVLATVLKFLLEHFCAGQSPYDVGLFLISGPESHRGHHLREWLHLSRHSFL